MTEPRTKCARCKRPPVEGYASCEYHMEYDRNRLLKQRLARGGKPRVILTPEQRALSHRLAQERKRRRAGVMPRVEITLADRQKKCGACGEWFDTGARIGTTRYEEKKSCGLPNCRREMELRKIQAARAVILKRVVDPRYAEEVAQRSIIIGHENGVPIRRVDRGVGYDE